MSGRTSIGVPGSIRAEVERFVEGKGVPLNIVEPGGGDVDVAECGERRESAVSQLCRGGWIRCGTALALAQRLNIKTGDLGSLLDVLDIKVRDCSLGCFKQGSAEGRIRPPGETDG